MRRIIEDNDEWQVQGDDSGNTYHYRKDFVGGGDRKEEYSLALMYGRKAVPGCFLKPVLEAGVVLITNFKEPDNGGAPILPAA